LIVSAAFPRCAASATVARRCICMPESRQQRRAAERLARQTLQKSGLSPAGSSSPLIMHTRDLFRILNGRNNHHRASDAAEAALKSCDLSLRNHPPDQILACRKGCSFCCYDKVVAMAPEVFRLAGFVRRLNNPEQANALDRIEAAHLATRGLTAEQRLFARKPCAMLADDVCTGYQDRPLVCRSANSADVKACENAFHDGVTHIPTAALPMLLKDRHAYCLIAALQASGLPTRVYELNHALWIAATSDEAERRWLAGEDVFEGVDWDEAAPPQVTQFITHLVAEARA
jgi:hypothetical protein